MLERHLEDPPEPPRPTAHVVGVDLLDALARALVVGRDVLHARPAVLVVGHLAVPVLALGCVDVRVDAALEDVGKVGRLGEGFVEVAREVDVAEGGDVAEVEERDVAERDRLGEVELGREDVELSRRPSQYEVVEVKDEEEEDKDDAP